MSFLASWRRLPTTRSSKLIRARLIVCRGYAVDAGGTRTWSRDIKQSPGGSAAEMWRKASRMGRENTALAFMASGRKMPPGGDRTLGFGKYGHMTYADALRKDPQYCDQVIARAENGGMDEEFNAFAAYLQLATQQADSGGIDLATIAASVPGHDTVLDFGKYTELTYAGALCRDPAYCESAMKRALSGGMDEEFEHFGRYVEAVLQASSRAKSEQASLQEPEPLKPAAKDNEVVKEASMDEASVLSNERVAEGAHAGETFASAYRGDPDYCKMLVSHMMKTGNLRSPMWPFVAYVLHRQLRQNSHS